MLNLILRGFRSAVDPNRWSTASVNPLQNVTPITPAADTKIPQTTLDLSQTSYHLRPSSHWSQVDQDNYDEEARHQARESLIQSWKDRLSGISLITTFFVATEAQLLSATASGNGSPISTLGNVANAGLTGALLIHSFAAIVSFLAAFFLISHTLHEAKLELKLDIDEVELEHTEPIHTSNGQQHRHVRERSVTKHDTRLVHVCRFNSSLPPIQLLERCNHLCMLLTAAGFTLEIVGILCYAWDKMGVAVSSFSSGLTFFCLVISVIVMRPIFT
ncbi:hypothetical protein BDM02DRAFT_3172063 [Thelephora ganbajun]|uniref:Uncharacterized protein n=1 Tax=Thelephora ganbajun TaxID=370292 RepID=A0ACB6ZAJ2_THEGA|nr:hypothetical protein BDM02DRAFT_3172063 [Thelephora ganbajun]